MSGYAIAVRFDGTPLQTPFFDSLHFRGEVPLLERDGVVVTGQVRIDAREDDGTDLELLLAAWQRWGDDTPAHLIGEFSFAIWDSRARRLLCARDRFGRRPLYYAHHDGALVVTNNLPTLLAIPGLGDELNEAAIGDFLLFGRNLDPRRTTFAHIDRVPAAHLLVATARGAMLRRYWYLEPRDRPRKIREADAQAGFRDVFSRAVADRARSGPIVLSLSGGIDSNAVAATLAHLPRRPEVHALTTVWDELFPDEEGRYAAIAAKAHGFSHELQPVDRYLPFEGWDDPRHRGLEPTDEPITAPFFDFVRRAAAKGRVVLTGEGGDPVLYSSHDYFFNLLKRGRLLRFALDAGGYALTRRKRPPLNVRSQFLRALGRSPAMPPFPTWLDPDFERRLGLRERWREIYDPPHRKIHPYRDDALRLLENPSWSRQFEATDPGWSGQPLEWTSPYFDARVVDFLFSLPPMPHFANKDIVRRGLRGWIPEEIRTRPKTPLPADPSVIRLREQPQQWVDLLRASPEIRQFVDPEILGNGLRKGTGKAYHLSQRAFGVSLALWLKRRNC